jgi:hypothetical protein
MKNAKMISFVLVFVLISIACNFLTPKSSNDSNESNSTGNLPVVDFTTPAEPLNVTVQLDEAFTTSGKFTSQGGVMSLTAGDGSVFTLEVPAKALETDTVITMTAVKSITGAPLSSAAVAAVQLEPSGLFFNEFVTLTVTPAQAIPIENQIIFGYEGSGQDYHLAIVDPKSREIKIKLLEFSGAGVGSGGDIEWAANLQNQASSASARLWQKFGEYSQKERMGLILGEIPDDIDTGWWKALEDTLNQFEDQVVLKESVAAELDCQHAKKALEDLIRLERMRQLFLSNANDASDNLIKTKDFQAKFDKLVKIGENCKAAYRIVGGLDDWQTDTTVCDIMQPFALTSPILTLNFSGGLSGTYSYSGGPFGAAGNGSYTISLPDGIGKPGTMTGGGEGVAGGATGSGTEFYTLTPLPEVSCP